MEKKMKYLVADTSAFIRGAPLHEMAEQVVTVAEVVNEIRSKRQLRHLSTYLCQLRVMTVFPENVSLVRDFSKKTGDFVSLSATDMMVIALTYQMEREHVGVHHLRTEPVMARTIQYTNRAYLGADSVAGFHQCKSVNDKQNKLSDEDGQEVYWSAGGEEEQWTDCSDQEDQDDSTSCDSDSERDWLTPDNLPTFKGSQMHQCQGSTVVGCLTTDFAMQNVLKQMGLQVVSLDGQLIRQLRTFILRCYACFKLTSRMGLHFCPNCGNQTLKKVAVSVSEAGEQQVHINTRRPLTARGKRFSLPTWQGGKHAVNPKLVPDARRPQQRPSRLARTKTDALHTDYVQGMSPFARRDVHSKSAQLGFDKGRPVFKYWMQRNPNESKRRTSHSKRT